MLFNYYLSIRMCFYAVLECGGGGQGDGPPYYFFFAHSNYFLFTRIVETIPEIIFFKM